MKKKTAIVSILFGILLIGIVSASFLTYFGKITGSVEVKAPVFYLDGQWGGAYYNLFVNEIPGEEIIVNLSDGNRLLFVTEPLDVENFYQARFDIKVWAKTNNESGNILQFQFVRIKPNLEEEIICVPPSVTLTNTQNYVKKETFCESNGEIALNPEDRIGLIIAGAGLESEYWISTGKDYPEGYSRIEVSAT